MIYFAAKVMSVIPLGIALNWAGFGIADMEYWVIGGSALFTAFVYAVSSYAEGRK